MDNNEKQLAPGAKKNNSEKDIKSPKGRSVTGKPLDAINVNPQDPKTSNLEESENSTAVMAFGRYNPPTVGHEKLINKVKSTADEHSGSAHIFASHSENTSKDPLPQSKKIGYLKKVAGKGTEVHGSSKSEPTIFHAASKLHAAGNKHLVIVAGSDRINEYKDKLEKYNGKEGKHGFFNFDSIKFVSAGERDPDAEGAEGMSGTKLRAHARAGEMKQFKSGLPKALHPHADEIANHIRTVGEGVEETELEERVLTLQQRRQRATQMRRLEPVLKVKRAMAAKRLAGQVQLTRRARKQAKDILRRRIAGRRGSSYHQLGPSDKINIDRQIDPKVKLIKFIAARLMPRIKQAEVQRFTAKQLGKSTRVKASGPVIQHYEHDPLLNLFVEMAEKDVYISENNFKALEKKSEKYGIELVQMFEMYRDAYLGAQELEEQTREQAAFISINAQCARLAEGLKDPKDNPCWKGYKPVGTKMKNGRQVPNCVPEETTNEAYYSVKPADVEAHRKAWQSGQITRGDYIKRVGLSAKKTARSPNEYTSPSDQPAAKTTTAKTGTLGKVAPPKSTSVLGTFKRFASSFGEAVEMSDKEKAEAQKIHRALSDETPNMAPAAAMSLKAAHKRLIQKHGQQWRQKAGINESNSKERSDAAIAMAARASASRAGSTKSEPELKHRVSVTVSDPQHTMVSKRKEKMEKKVRISAKSESDAIELAKNHYKKQGYKIHDANHIGIVEETKPDTPPFEGGRKVAGNVKDKSGAVHTPMSRARHLARAAMKNLNQKKAVKEGTNMNEAVKVEKKKYSWGKMVTVHDGSSTSYPLHPEHQKEIKKLRDGDKTSFKDETGRNVHVHREGDKVHLMSKDRGYKPTTVHYSHFDEATSAYGRINARFKSISGRTLGAAAKEHGDEAKKLQKEIEAQQKEIDRRKAAMKNEENLDELSKSTLGSYVKKASTNARINSMISKDFDHKAMTSRKPSTRDAYYGLSSKHKQKSWKRSDNVAKAVDRLTKEEVDPTHKKILNKAKTSVPKAPKSEYERKVVSYLKKKYSEEVEKELRDALDRHTDKALAANRRGDDEAVKVHQVYINKIKTKMAKFAKNESMEEIEQVDEESLTAGKRLISKHGEGSHTARVYKDTEYNEYQVHHYKDGKHMGEGPVSYHDDKEDAEATAKQSIKRGMKEEVEEIEELSKSTLASYAKKAVTDARLKQGTGKEYEALSRIKRSSNTKAALARLGRQVKMKAQSREMGAAKAIDRLAKEEVELEEKLKPSMGAGEYVSDFKKSDAPQFQGKSKEKRRQMAIAAYLSAKRK